MKNHHRKTIHYGKRQGRLNAAGGPGQESSTTSRISRIGSMMAAVNLLYEHLREPINTPVMFFVPIPILNGNP